MAFEEITIAFNDLEDFRQTLTACSTYFTALDLQEAQVHFGRVQKSPISHEIERVQQRLNGYIGDYLLAKHEAEQEEELSEDVVEVEPVEEEEEEEEELSLAPLGAPTAKQQGRRVTREELLEREAKDVEPS